MTNNKLTGIVLGSAIVFGLILLLMYLKQKRQQDEIDRLLEDNENLQKNNVILLNEYLKSTNDIPKNVQDQLINLAATYRSIDENISEELINTLNLYVLGSKPECILKLGKIIENLLKKKIEESESNEVVSNRKFDFVQLIDKAKQLLIIGKHEFNICNVIREFRNREAHQLNVQISDNWALLTILGSLEVIFKLAGETNQSN